MVTAKTHWVWTDKAVKKNTYQEIKAGEPIWEAYRKRAPQRWIDEGLIREAGEDEGPEGQAAFDF